MGEGNVLTRVYPSVCPRGGGEVSPQSSWGGGGQVQLAGGGGSVLSPAGGGGQVQLAGGGAGGSGPAGGGGWSAKIGQQNE